MGIESLFKKNDFQDEEGLKNYGESIASDLDDRTVEELAASAREKTGQTAPVVNPITIADYYGFTVYKTTMDDEPLKIKKGRDEKLFSAAMVDKTRKKNGKVILVDNKCSKDELAFLVSAEIGEYLLREEPEDEYVHGIWQKHPAETAAARFAVSLLVPEDDLKLFAPLLGSTCPVRDIQDVAYRYGVDFDTARDGLVKYFREYKIRLKDLHMPEEDESRITSDLDENIEKLLSAKEELCKNCPYAEKGE